ncbi:TPA: hypothetical protein DEP96_01435 [Candidatus Uhrbacteria bacterium]|nr:hypothetical protein [Candidatus Uhrbacteria bacterium]
MTGALNIPLEGQITTRRDYARVVALYSALGLGLVLAVVAWRLQYVVSPTLRYQPKDTVMSVHLLVTPKNKRLITEHLHGLAILTGAPVTLGEIIAESKREVTFDISNDGLISYVVDTKLSVEASERLAGFGYVASIQGRTTVISRTGEEIIDTGAHVTLRALSPFFQGEVVTYGEQAVRESLHLNAKGLMIRGTDVAVDDATMPMVKADVKVLANLTIPANSLQLPSVVATLLTIPADSRALTMLLTNGGSILLTEDAEGLGYYLSLAPGDMTVDEAASLGKDIMNRVSLATLAWTTEDGSVYNELRSDPANITTEIKAEETYTFITLSNNTGKTLRIAKTPSLMTIANREISLESGAKPASTCLGNAHTWFATSLITEQAPMSLLNNNRAVSLFLKNFSEVAIDNNQTRLCW